MKFRIPKTVFDAKVICKNLCDEHGVKIYFDKKRANDYNCMGSDYISQIETPFWCPISQKVRR